MKKFLTLLTLAIFSQTYFAQNIITTVAGTGSAGYSGDGGPATGATLNFPVKVASYNGSVYIADDGNNVIRKIDGTTGVITTIAGTGTAGYSGDGGPATSALLNGPWGIGVDVNGNVYFSDAGNGVVRKIDALNGTISTIAGNGTVGYSGDGGPALSASFNGITGLALGPNGDIYVTDDNNNVVRKIDAVTTNVTTIAGNGTYGYGGDGGPAINAVLSFPVGISVGASGNIYLTDSDNDRIRMINNAGIITTIAGNGNGGYNGDNIPATSATLSNPWDATTDALGNLYIADFFNCRIRKVDASTGLISTYAGGTCGYSGDGGPATPSGMSAPTGLCFDNNGNLIIVDTYNNVIRKVGPGQTQGYSCANPIAVEAQNCSTILLKNVQPVMWFSFVADSTSQIITVVGDNNLNHPQIHAVNVFSGTCSDLNFIRGDTLSGLDSQQVYVAINGLIKNQVYYLKMDYIINQNADAFLYFCKSGFNSSASACPTNGCVIIDENFDYLQSIPVADQSAPFYKGDIPCWGNAWGTPQITSGNWAYMWAESVSPNGQGEAIYRTLPTALDPTKHYVLQYDYSATSGLNLDQFNVYLVSQGSVAFSGATQIPVIPVANRIDQMTGIATQTLLHRAICFVPPASNLDQIILFPKNTTNNSQPPQGVFIDNFTIHEIDITPALSTINCQSTTFNMCFIPNITYQWSPSLGLSCTSCYNPTASPAVSTTYNLTLGGMANSCSESTTINVVPNSVQPVLNISPNPSCAGEGVCFTFGNQPANGTYDFLPGYYNNNYIGPTPSLNSTFCDPSTNVLCAYPTDGNYNATLIFTDQNGCKGQTIVPVTVNPLSASPSFVQNCDVFNFYANATCASSNANYLWNFGDGTTSSTPNPQHIYATSGNFNVSLIIHNGCASVSYNLSVSPNITCCGINTHGTRQHITWPANTVTVISSSFNGVDFTALPGATILINSPTGNSSTSSISFTNCSFLMYPGSKIVINTKDSPNHTNSLGVGFAYCHLYGCSELWEGIRFSTDLLPNDIHYNLTVNLALGNTILEDAWIGIDNNLQTTGYAAPVKITVTYSLFNKNWTDLNFDQSILATGSYSHNSVYSCRKFPYLNPFQPLKPNFTNGNAGSYYNSHIGSVPFANVLPSLLHNYSGSSISTYGIIMFSSALSVGGYSQGFNLATNENIFDRHLYGIYGQQINMTLERQFFYNLAFTGILSDGHQLGSHNGPPQLTLGTSNTLANNFFSCGTGIYARYQHYNINASYNVFRDIDNGIHIEGFGASSSSPNCIVSHNELKNVGHNAIWFNLNSAINANIQFNQIYYPTASAKNYTSKGIVVNEANSSSAKYNIDQNNIGYTYTGIECTNTYQTQITSNSIQVNTPPNSLCGTCWNYGINNVSCYNNTIGNNIITGDNIQYHYWEYGINSVDHPGQNIFCNNITGINTGLNLQAPSLTLSGYPIRHNDLNENLIDVWMLNNCKLGPQKTSAGPFNFSVDNRFYHNGGFLYHSFCSGQGSLQWTDGTASTFFVRSSYPFDMTVNGVDFSNAPLSYPMTPSHNILKIPFVNNCTSNTNGGGRLINMAQQVAVDSLVPPTDHRNRFVTRKSVFDNLMNENINTASNPALNAFKIAQAVGNIGTFYSVDKNISDAFALGNSSLLNSAASLNSALIPADSIELLHKEVNTTYVNYLLSGATFTSADVVILRRIAPLCPYTYGTAVWQSRSMLAGIDSIPYYNNCEVPIVPASGGQRIANATDSHSTLNHGAIIYPNPNSGQFKISYSGPGKTVAVEVYNVFGELILQRQVEVSSSSEVNIEGLSDGVYLVKILIDGIHNKTDRIIVTR